LSTPQPAPTLTIGQVARRAGVRDSRIRYYERIGVLPQPERVCGQRRYTDDVLRRLAIIDVAQRAGLSLGEIRDLTGPSGRDRRASERIRELADHRLTAMEALIQRAQAVRQWLRVARTCDCESVDVCDLFVDHKLAPPRTGSERVAADALLGALMTPMRKTSVYLADEQAQRLARLAREEGRSQAEVVREAIARYQSLGTDDRDFALDGCVNGSGESIADRDDE